MKKWRNRLILILALLLLTGCKNGAAQEGKNSAANPTISTGKEQVEPVLQVVTTFFVPYEWAKAVGGGLVEVSMLAKPGENPAEHPLTKEDRALLETCDVFIYAGNKVDPWAAEAQKSLGKNASVYSMQEDMTRLIADGSAPDLYETGKAGEQENYWMTPVNAMLLSSDISGLFIEKDPEHADQYNENFAAYLDKLSEIDQEMNALKGHAAAWEMAFVGENSYLSFAAEYQLNYHMSTEATAEGYAAAFNDEGIGVFFYDEYSDGKLVKDIQSLTKAVPVQMHAGIVISQKEFEGGTTFVDLLQGNVESLRKVIQ